MNPFYPPGVLGGASFYGRPTIDWAGTRYPAPEACPERLAFGANTDIYAAVSLCTRCDGTGYDLKSWHAPEDMNSLSVLVQSLSTNLTTSPSYEGQGILKARLIIASGGDPLSFTSFGQMFALSYLQGLDEEEYRNRILATFLGGVRNTDIFQRPFAKRAIFDAMRYGLAPKQIEVPYPLGSNAAGSAVQGLPPSGSDIVRDLISLIPALAQFRTVCPLCLGLPTNFVTGNAGSGLDPWLGEDTLTRLIPHLNDRHHVSREDIADWLESLDVDLAFHHPEHSPTN